MLSVLKLQTALRSFTPSTSSWTSPHPRTAFVKSRLFPCWEPHTFAEWEADIMRCAQRSDLEGTEMRSMIQQGRVREVSIYERTQKGANRTEEKEEYVLVEIVNKRGRQLCLLKFEREGIEVQVKKSVRWGVKSAAAGEASNTDQVSTTKRTSSAPAECKRTPPRPLNLQKKRARSNGSRGPTQCPAHGPVPVLKQTITCRDTVVSTRVSRSDKVNKIIRFDQNGPRVLDLFITLSTIDKCEQAMIEHGRLWFVAVFVGIMQGAFEERRVWIRKDTTLVANGPFGKEQRKKANVNEAELQMFLKDFTAHRTQSILNLQAWDEAMESEARITRQASGKKRDIARQDIWLEREIGFRKDAEADAWRKMYKSLDAVEQARAKLHRAEADREEAENEREKAEKSRRKAEARFADVLAEKKKLGYLM